METMEIGLAAHIGSDAKIQAQKFSSIGFLLGFIVTCVLSVILIGIAYYTFKYYKQRGQEKSAYKLSVALEKQKQGEEIDPYE